MNRTTIDRPDLRGIALGRRTNDEIAELGALNPETVLANRLEMRAARDEGDVLPAFASFAPK